MNDNTNEIELTKLFRSKFETISPDYGFLFRDDNLLVKITEQNVMHIISFDVGSFGFTCSVAIQPLYVFEYQHIISLSMGTRLSKLKNNLREWWRYDDIEQGLNEIKDLLIRNGIPYLDRFGSPKGIIDFIKNDRVKEYGIFFTRQYLKKQYLGFSLLYVGRISEGVTVLEQMVSGTAPDAADFIVEYNKEVQELLKIIKNEPNKTGNLLQGFVEENKKELDL